MPGGLEVEPALRARIEALARETGAALVVGGVGLALDVRGRPAAYYDSAFVLGPDGRLRDRYDKSHLVPFGEYIPFQDLLGRFLSAVARGIAQVGVEAGDAPRAVAVPLRDGREIRVGIPICYELLFPDLVRRFAADGGRALLAITNDAWYGRTGAPYQFLAITELRAAETGLAIARAANTGVSAFIDGAGDDPRRHADLRTRLARRRPPAPPGAGRRHLLRPPRRRVRLRVLDRSGSRTSRSAFARSAHAARA